MKVGQVQHSRPHNMNSINGSGNVPAEHAADFAFADLVNDPNFEHFTDLIKGEISDSFAKICPNYDCSNGCYDHRDSSHGHFALPTQENFFDFNVADFDPNCGEVDIDGEQSRAPTPTTSIVTNNSTKKSYTKADRSKTIISERRRRGKMKEKLYALRALVPNISKMDKASIIGDAVLYVQDLQMQAKKLKTEIAVLESSLTETDRYQQGSSQNLSKMKFSYNHPVIKKIMQIDVFQVEEREFYVRLVCNKGLGVAVSLYKALESISLFNVQSSNLATGADRYVLTFTLNVRECKMDMDMARLRLLIVQTFLSQGFDFGTTLLA